MKLTECPRGNGWMGRGEGGKGALGVSGGSAAAHIHPEAVTDKQYKMSWSCILSTHMQPKANNEVSFVYYSCQGQISCPRIKLYPQSLIFWTICNQFPHFPIFIWVLSVSEWKWGLNTWAWVKLEPRLKTPPGALTLQQRRSLTNDSCVL